MEAMTGKYPYPTSNQVLIDELRLVKHPEGGYFAETDRSKETVRSPYADGAERAVSTTIYYLLTKGSPSGVIHRNKSRTMHVLHQGRAIYTLITPPINSDAAAKIDKVTMGIDTKKGEVRQLMVEGGVWKMSEIPADDLMTSDVDGENVGCLITEVVSPGFHWEDHEFLTHEGLQALFTHSSDAMRRTNIEGLRKHVKAAA